MVIIYENTFKEAAKLQFKQSLMLRLGVLLV